MLQKKPGPATSENKGAGTLPNQGGLHGFRFYEI
jgi:hypothetical protein